VVSIWFLGGLTISFLAINHLAKVFRTKGRPVCVVKGSTGGAASRERTRAPRRATGYRPTPVPRRKAC
jgi:hypothetical protein